MSCFKPKGDFGVCPHCGWVEGTAPEQAYHLHPGVILAGRYVIGTVIGFGGFGALYKAWDAQLGTIIAIKEFYPSGLVSRVPGEKQVVVFSGEKRESYQLALGRFLDEARNMAKFDRHPNIVHVFNFFEENNTAYIIMEYLEGISLSEYLKQRGKLSPEEAIQITTPVAEALAAIHATGIIHRDIHPGNIYITAANQIKVIDFGAAKFAATEDEKTLTVVVTQGYASPEQYRSKSKQGPYTDIYGLGATFYKMITGQIPEESIDRQVDDQLKRPSTLGVKLPPHLDKTVMKALAVKPELRFQKASQFKDALVDKNKVDFPEVEYKKRRLRRAVAISALSLAFLGVAAAISLYLTVWRPESLTDISGPEKIAVWAPLSEDESVGRSQQAAYEEIRRSFATVYPQFEIEIEFNFSRGQAAYDRKITAALSAGAGPTLFQADGFAGDLTQYAAPLDLLRKSLPLREYLFLPDYQALYPTGVAMPLGFHLTVLYGNDYAIGEAGLEMPDGVAVGAMVPAPAGGGATGAAGGFAPWNSLPQGRGGVGAEREALGSLLALRGDIGLTAGQLRIEDTAADSVIQLRAALGGGVGYDPLTALAGDRLMYLVGDTARRRDVQAALPGYYSVAPLTDGAGRGAAELTDTWAVSLQATENQRKAAMLFLSYLLSNYSQDLRYLQNDQAIPLHRATFDQFVEGNANLAFLPDVLTAVLPAGEGAAAIRRFGAAVYDDLLTKTVSAAEIREYIRNYSDT
ncbi:MAG: serine/threonine protein kinase [Peptococcaceae bacterium]|nr:serine/threonine protein kinase [Peptococcaceae bacterium]